MPMDEAKRVLFESPTYLYVALVVAELALAGIWYERRSRRVAMLLVVPILLAGVVFAIEAAVVTNREQIIEAAREIVADLNEGKTDTLDKYLDDEFSGFYLNKKRAITVAKIELGSKNIARIKLTRIVVDVSGRTAKMRAGTAITIKEYNTTVPILWNVYWVKRSDGWRIAGVDEPEKGVEF